MGFDDESAARELDLYAENESALYGQFKAIIENLKKKIAAGTYKAASAPKLWGYWYHAAAKRYVREFGGDVRTAFPAALRGQLARDRAKDEYEKIKNGEYGPVAMKTKAAKRTKAKRSSSGRSGAPKRARARRGIKRRTLTRLRRVRMAFSRRGHGVLRSGVTPLVAEPVRWSPTYLSEAIQLASDATLEKIQAENRDPEIAKLLRIEFAKRGH